MRATFSIINKEKLKPCAIKLWNGHFEIVLISSGVFCIFRMASRDTSRRDLLIFGNMRTSTGGKKPSILLCRAQRTNTYTNQLDSNRDPRDTWITGQTAALPSVFSLPMAIFVWLSESLICRSIITLYSRHIQSYCSLGIIAIIRVGVGFSFHVIKDNWPVCGTITARPVMGSSHN